MNNLASQNKNAFNKLCTALKNTPSFKDGHNLKSVINISIAGNDLYVALYAHYTYKNGKVSVKNEGNMVYIIWESDFILNKLEFENTYTWRNQKELGDAVANLIYNKFIADDYFVEHLDGTMKVLLDYDDIGISAKSLRSYSTKEILNTLRGTKDYQRLKKFYDYVYGYTPIYELKDEVHKKLSNRNSIPIMFWDADKDSISWASDALYSSSNLMTKKNRSESPLGSFMEMKSNLFRSNCAFAMRYAPIKPWGIFKYKDPETGKEIESILR